MTSLTEGSDCHAQLMYYHQPAGGSLFANNLSLHGARTNLGLPVLARLARVGQPRVGDISAAIFPLK